MLAQLGAKKIRCEPVFRGNAPAVKLSQSFGEFALMSEPLSAGERVHVTRILCKVKCEGRIETNFTPLLVQRTAVSGRRRTLWRCVDAASACVSECLCFQNPQSGGRGVEQSIRGHRD